MTAHHLPLLFDTDQTEMSEASLHSTTYTILAEFTKRTTVRKTVECIGKIKNCNVSTENSIH